MPANREAETVVKHDHFHSFPWIVQIAVYAAIPVVLWKLILWHFPSAFQFTRKLRHLENAQFYSGLFFPLVAACASFCLTLSSRIAGTATRIRELSKLFSECSSFDENKQFDLLRCSTIVRQIRLLKGRYLISRVSFSSKISGIIVLSLMYFCAWIGAWGSAFFWLNIGLWILCSGFLISISDVFSGYRSLQRELDYVNLRYEILIMRGIEDSSLEGKMKIAKEWRSEKTKFNGRLEIVREYPSIPNGRLFHPPSS